MIGYLVLLLFVDASLVVVQLFVVDVDLASLMLLDSRAANHLVCLLYVVDVDVLFLSDDVLDELQVEEDVEEDVYAQLDALLDVLISGRSC